MFMPIPDTWIKKYHYWIRAYGPLLFQKRSTLHKFYRLFKPDKSGETPAFGASNNYKIGEY